MKFDFMAILVSDMCKKTLKDMERVAEQSSLLMFRVWACRFEIYIAGCIQKARHEFLVPRFLCHISLDCGASIYPIGFISCRRTPLSVRWERCRT